MELIAKTILFVYLENNEDSFYNAIIDFEESEGEPNAKERFEEEVGRLRHLFRIAMSLGTDNDRIKALNLSLNQWPFSHQLWKEFGL